MPDGGGIVLRFDGTMLNIAAPEPIAMVEVVTVDGIVLANTNPDCAEAVLDASGWPGNICIVMVRLASGSVASYTLSR